MFDPILNNMISTLHQPAMFLTTKGHVIHCNETMLTLYGIPRSKFINRNIFNLCKKHQLPPPFPSLENGLNKSESKTIINDKTIQWFASNLMTEQLGDIIFVIGFDITSFISASRLEKNINTSIIDQIPNHYIFWKDRNSAYLGCNSALANSVGLKSSADIIGKTDYDLPTAKEQSDAYRADDLLVMESGLPKLNIEEYQTLADGEQRTLSTSKSPLFDDQGKVCGVLAIYSDITKQKKIEAELRVAKEAAEAANHAKTAFIANMSHDIRTPLTGIIGLSALLEDGALSPEEKQNAHWIHSSSEQLLSLLNGIIDVVSADNVGENEVHEEPFDLRQCIEGIVQLQLPTTKYKNLDLRVHIDKNIPAQIISDRMKLHRILLNLLGNAIKFTKTGHITIDIKCLQITESDVKLEFGVTDTGVGIPPELQEKVFDRFYRGTPSYNGTYMGHGVGLHIAQSYVTLLGSQITLTSQEGIGTTFNFNLSCKIGHKKITAPLFPTSCGDTQIDLDPADKPQDVGGIGSMDDDMSKPYILLIEDNPIAMKVVQSIATQAGCHFESAMDGTEALRLATSKPFDLIITDIGLPDFSGHEFTRRLRAWEISCQKKPVPVVGLTAHARETAMKECIDSGMNDVFSKPPRLVMLIKIMKEYIIHHDTKAPHLSGKLGTDLPDTESELFTLDLFPLFAPNDGLKQINDIHLMSELLKIFVSDKMQKDIHAMEHAYQSNDWSTIEKLAHKMKGGVAYLGTHRMHYACQYFERYYKAGHRDLLKELYHQLITVNHQTIEAVNTWLRKVSAP